MLLLSVPSACRTARLSACPPLPQPGLRELPAGQELGNEFPSQKPQACSTQCPKTAISFFPAGYGNLLQYSCLENPRERGAWQATVHTVTEGQTRLKRLSTTHTRIQILGVQLTGTPLKHSLPQERAAKSLIWCPEA